MKQPVLSIIIPAFNAACTLPRCLGSICRQKNFTDYELIIVNDGSDDETKSIAEKYQAIHNNIVLINQENHGVSVARNTGLANAHGKYVTFVDADDKVGAKPEAFEEYKPYYTTAYQSLEYVSKIVPMPYQTIQLTPDTQYFARMVDAAEQNAADVGLANKLTAIKQDEGVYKIKIHKYSSLFNFSEKPAVKQMLLNHADIRESANFAIYRRDFLEKYNLRFEENMPLDEDMLFCMLAVLKANKVISIPDSTYFYNRHENTLSNISSSIISDHKYSIAYIQRFSILLKELQNYPQYAESYKYWTKIFALSSRPEIYNENFPADNCAKCEKQTCENCAIKETNSVLFQQNIATFLKQSSKQH
jgi:glycosyltransferase involved in cell wall biosynthesis